MHALGFLGKGHEQITRTPQLLTDCLRSVYRPRVVGFALTCVRKPIAVATPISNTQNALRLDIVTCRSFDQNGHLFRFESANFFVDFEFQHNRRVGQSYLNRLNVGWQQKEKA